MEIYTDDLILKTMTDDDVSEFIRMWNFEKGEVLLDEAQKVIEYMCSIYSKNILSVFCNI